ncbi:MAG TPA: hypothetical protein DD714_00470 [Candidatus Omnitrophica bacterium]|nr:hypothetical protein [Candidatus Omnitrophota bacterium]
MASGVIEERRKLRRVDFQGRVEIDPVEPRAQTQAPSLPTSSVNLSEGGMCVRVSHELVVRSRVVLRVFANPRKRPVECDGRVAWVVQRLDLRTTPPYLYDVGVEFLKPPESLRRFAARLGLPLKPVDTTTSKRLRLSPATIRDRHYLASLEQERSGSTRWHVIVTVDGTPCFGQRCDSLQEAKAAWQRFRRQLGRKT